MRKVLVMTIFEEVDILKRVAADKKISDKKVLEFDAENKTAIIQGSGQEPYNVTLDSCNCMDFAIHGKICKHIYKLQDMLGIAPDLPPRNLENEKEFKKSIPGEIAHFEQFYLNGAISIEKFAKIISALQSK